MTGGHTRVFVNSQGLPTYEAKDIGNFAYKIDASKTKGNLIYFGDDKGFDYSIVSTGNEIDEYFKLINKVIDIIFKNYKSKDDPSGKVQDYSGKQIHISNGMLRLSSGKMSSRKGSVIPADEMINDLTIALILKSGIEAEGMSSEDELRIKYLGINAFKFNFLKQAMGKDVIYDREKTTDVNGDSGVYINYTYARMKALIDKAKNENIEYGFYKMIHSGGLIKIEKGFSLEKLKDESTIELERLLSQYDYIMSDAVNSLAPHYVAQYTIKIAHSFNKFYNNYKIFDTDDKDENRDIIMSYRLSVIDVTMKVLESLLYALGMRVIDKV